MQRQRVCVPRDWFGMPLVVWSNLQSEASSLLPRQSFEIRCALSSRMSMQFTICQRPCHACFRDATLCLTASAVSLSSQLCFASTRLSFSIVCKHGRCTMHEKSVQRELAFAATITAVHYGSCLPLAYSIHSHFHSPERCGGKGCALMRLLTCSSSAEIPGTIGPNKRSE